MELVKTITYPDLILDHQDTSDVWGYHWVEVGGYGKATRKTVPCILMKYEKNSTGLTGYYLPLKPPYEICREYNVPENHLGFPIVMYTEREFNALKSLTADCITMPTMEFVNSIPAATWVQLYCEVVKMYPERMNTLHKLSFMVTSDDSLYKHCYLSCYPFMHIERTEDGGYKYKDKNTFLDGTNNVKIDGEYRNHIGNVYFSERMYFDDEPFQQSLCPIIAIDSID